MQTSSDWWQLSQSCFSRHYCICHWLLFQTNIKHNLWAPTVNLSSNWQFVSSYDGRVGWVSILILNQPYPEKTHDFWQRLPESPNRDSNPRSQRWKATDLNNTGSRIQYILLIKFWSHRRLAAFHLLNLDYDAHSSVISL